MLGFESARQAYEYGPCRTLSVAATQRRIRFGLCSDLFRRALSVNMPHANDFGGRVWRQVRSKFVAVELKFNVPAQFHEDSIGRDFNCRPTGRFDRKFRSTLDLGEKSSFHARLFDPACPEPQFLAGPTRGGEAAFFRPARRELREVWPALRRAQTPTGPSGTYRGRVQLVRLADLRCSVEMATSWAMWYLPGPPMPSIASDPSAP